MGKFCKIGTWVACALVIIAVLLVAIYFIVADAIDRKSEACLYRHFSTSGLLQKFNVTTDHDSVKSTYSDEDCKSFVGLSRNQTIKHITSMNLNNDCMENEFKVTHIESLMLNGVAKKFGWQYGPLEIKKYVNNKSEFACDATDNATLTPK